MNDSSLLSTGSSLTSSHFNLNDDYDYLINCKDIITTCQEALLESDFSVPSVSSIGSSDKPSSDPSHESSTSDCPSSGPSSLSSLPSSNSAIADSDLTSSCSLFDFNQWLTYTEKRLDDVCFCQQTTDVYLRQKNIQSEIQRVGNKYISGIRNLVNANTSKNKSKALVKLEKRWHTLWVRSLEYLIIIEDRRCPKHFSGCREKSDPKPEVKDKSVDSSIGQENSLRSTSSIVLPTTSDYYSPSSSESFSPSTSSTPKAKSRTVASLVEQFNDFASSNTSGLMRNRRVQTMYATVCTGDETGDLKGGKYEIIQKDIGYSSDADTSDANCDAISNGGAFVGSTASSASSISSEVSSGGFNSKTGTCQSPDTQYKKRQVKRRFRSKLTTSTSCGALTSCTKQRPWSFHAASEWTDWDYYQPPSFIPSTPTPTEPAAVITGPIVAPVITPPSTRSVATSTASTCCTSDGENNEQQKVADESKETSYALIVTLSLFSLLLSVFFASNRSAHLELLYPTSSPPI